MSGGITTQKDSNDNVFERSPVVQVLSGPALCTQHCMQIDDPCFIQQKTRGEGDNNKVMGVWR